MKEKIKVTVNKLLFFRKPSTSPSLYPIEKVQPAEFRRRSNNDATYLSRYYLNLFQCANNGTMLWFTFAIFQSPGQVENYTDNCYTEVVNRHLRQSGGSGVVN